jgi:hypothetical protein
MNPDPFDYDLVIRYLDDSASEDDRRQARELLLSNPEARAYLLEVAGQMVHLKDQYSAYLNTAEEDLDTLPCQLPPQPSQLVEARKQPVGRHLKLMFNKVDRLRLFAGSLLFIAVMAFTVFAFLNDSGKIRKLEISLQVVDHLGLMSINHQGKDFKPPFSENLRLSAGDTIETQNWLSWAELKLDSGAILTVPVNSKIHIRALTQDRMELDVISGGVRIKSPQNDPLHFVIRSERLHVNTSGSEILVWDINFNSALAACFRGSADAASVDESQQVQVKPGWMASTEYQDKELVLIPHPEIVHQWSTLGMKPIELGTGTWKNAERPDEVKLLAGPKMYVYPDGTAHQMQEVLLAVWRKPGIVRLKGGSRLIVSGRYSKKSPVSFALRTHSDLGKLLDVFVKTERPENLAEPDQTWRVEIPVEEMKSIFKSNQDSLGSHLFNISVFTDEDVGLEINSVELIAPN